MNRKLSSMFNLIVNLSLFSLSIQPHRKTATSGGLPAEGHSRGYLESLSE